MRLKQGDMNSATVFSDDPVAMAKHWAAQGAKRLHIVDLNGAIAGRPKNEKVIRAMIAAVGDQVPIQLGGGIRDLDAIESYLDAGVTYVIIGTAAVKNPGFLSDAVLRVSRPRDRRARREGRQGRGRGLVEDDRPRRHRPREEVRGVRHRGADLHRHRPRRHDDRHQHRGHVQARAAAQDAGHRLGRPEQPEGRGGHLPEAGARGRDRRHRRARAVRRQDRPAEGAGRRRQGDWRRHSRARWPSG